VDSLTEKPTAFEFSRDMIAETQRGLSRLGFDPGKPDGIIGPRTREALRLFQKEMGMTPDGNLTAEVVTILRDAR
jgi:membrane-bound lytic murein transglycosylase B